MHTEGDSKVHVEREKWVHIVVEWGREVHIVHSLRIDLVQVHSISSSIFDHFYLTNKIIILSCATYFM